MQVSTTGNCILPVPCYSQWAQASFCALRNAQLGEQHSGKGTAWQHATNTGKILPSSCISFTSLQLNLFVSHLELPMARKGSPLTCHFLLDWGQIHVLKQEHLSPSHPAWPCVCCERSHRKPSLRCRRWISSSWNNSCSADHSYQLGAKCLEKRCCKDLCVGIYFFVIAFEFFLQGAQSGIYGFVPFCPHNSSNHRILWAQLPWRLAREWASFRKCYKAFISSICTGFWRPGLSQSKSGDSTVLYLSPGFPRVCFE